MVRIRAEIVDRITPALTGWDQPPAHASLFGSVARGEADKDSDIDILLVRGPQVADAGSDQWDKQVDELSSSNPGLDR